MSAADDTANRPGAKTRADGFIKDAEGRILFFPYGVLWLGYVVPTAERELALRAAVPRYRKFDRIIVAFRDGYFLSRCKPVREA